MKEVISIIISVKDDITSIKYSASVADSIILACINQNNMLKYKLLYFF